MPACSRATRRASGPASTEADGRHHPQRHLAADGAGQAADLGDGAFKLAHRPVDPLQQRAAGLGQLHPPAVPGEQRHPHLRLQQPDLPGQRRLRQVQPVRRAAERAGLGHFAEGAELLQVHPTKV